MVHSHGGQPVFIFTVNHNYSNPFLFIYVYGRFMSNIQKLENISQEFRFTVTVNHVKHSKEYAKSFFAPAPVQKVTLLLLKLRNPEPRGLPSLSLPCMTYSPGVAEAGAVFFAAFEAEKSTRGLSSCHRTGLLSAPRQVSYYPTYPGLRFVINLPSS